VKFIAWCVLLPAMLFAGMARAEEELQLERGQLVCSTEKGLCIVRQDDLERARKAMGEAKAIVEAQAEAIERMARELKTLRESKGCAKLQVLPQRRVHADL
jgi:hypothetical protein